MSQTTHMPLIHGVAEKIEWIYGKLDFLAPAGFFILRAWVAWAFLKSGYLKITNWSSTMYLFENEFAVPLLSPEIAAYLATFIELVFPSLLIAGIAGRLSAFVLFTFNIMAVISYPDLDAAGARDHQVWGIMLLLLLLSGPGKLSIDHWLKQRFGAKSAT